MATGFDRGHAAADAWLGAHLKAIGKTGTVDLRAMLHGDDEGLTDEPASTKP